MRQVTRRGDEDAADPAVRREPHGTRVTGARGRATVRHTRASGAATDLLVRVARELGARCEAHRSAHAHHAVDQVDHHAGLRLVDDAFEHVDGEFLGARVLVHRQLPPGQRRQFDLRLAHTAHARTVDTALHLRGIHSTAEFIERQQAAMKAQST